MGSFKKAKQTNNAETWLAEHNFQGDMKINHLGTIHLNFTL